MQHAAPWIPALWHGINNCVLWMSVLLLLWLHFAFFFFFKKRPLVSEPSLKFSPLPFHFVFAVTDTFSHPHFSFFQPTCGSGWNTKSTNVTLFTPARRNNHGAGEWRERWREMPAGQSDMTTLFVTMASCFLYWLRETERTEGGMGKTSTGPDNTLSLSRHDTEGEILNWRRLTWCTFHPSI